MQASPENLPDPLRSFEGLGGPVVGALACVDAAHARYRALRDAGRILPNSVEALRVELTYHSNAIEGSTLTLRETQLIIEGRAPTSGKSLREVYEARNHDRALQLVEAWATSRPASAPISEQDVLDVHARVLADIDDAGAGRYRTDRVLIKGARFIPPGSHRFGGLMPMLLERASRADAHPAVAAAELHYNLVAVHPFADGNGRTARLLMNYALLRRRYPHAVVEVERCAEYLNTLEEANAGRCGPFAAFIAGCVERSIVRLIGSE